MFQRTKLSSGILIAFGATTLLGAPAFAQDVQRVEITGSSIKRVDAEGALPVVTVTKEEIARSGATSTEQLLQSVSSLSSMGSTVNATGAGTSTYGLSAISLRGLGSSRTLVLVNGRRLAAFAGGDGTSVNVNAIPLAAIERVEILNDGASAVYGSDAIGGVVNFILSKSLEGMEVSGSLGVPSRSGGGSNGRVSIAGGLGNIDKDGYNIAVSATVEQEKALYGRERDFANTSTRLPYFIGAATGQGNIQGAWTPGSRSADGTWTQGSGFTGFAGGGVGSSYGNPLAATGKCGDIRMFDAGKSSKSAPICQYDSAPDVGLIPDRKLATVSLNGTMRLGKDSELFGDVLYSKSSVTQTYQPSPVRNSFLVTDSLFASQGVDPVLLLQPTNPNYQVAKNYLLSLGTAAGTAIGNSNLPFAITARVFDFGPRSNTDDSAQARVVTGVRGLWAGQDYEVAISHNENKLTGKVGSGYFSQVEYAKIISASNVWNPWSLTQDPALVSALAGAVYSGSTLNAKSSSNGIDGRLSGELFKLPGGMAQYAFGAAARNERFELNPAAALSSGDIAGLGGAVVPMNKTRSISSVFSELNLPLIKDFEGNVAFRGDHYSDVGSSVTGKGSVRWRANDMLMVRSSIGSGFRAPTLTDLWYPQVLGTSAQFNDKGQTDLQVPALSGGNPDVKPESSRQRSIGIVLQPIKTVSASIDYFDIDVNGIISTPSAQEVVSQYRGGNAAYQGMVVLDANGDVASIKTILGNFGTAKVQGFDLNLNYRDSFAIGKLEFNLAGTYMAKFDQTTTGGDVSHKVGTMVDAAGAPVVGADSGGVVVRWRHQLSGTWSNGPYSLTLTQNYYSGYEDSHDLDDNRHFVPAQSIYDLNVSYKHSKDLRVGLGVKNLFDKNPPLYIPASNQFQAGYDINMYDPRARMFYLTANYKFF